MIKEKLVQAVLRKVAQLAAPWACAFNRHRCRPKSARPSTAKLDKNQNVCNGISGLTRESRVQDSPFHTGRHQMIKSRIALAASS